MIPLCCSFASAFPTFRSSSSLSVQRSNSTMHTICRASLTATPSGRLPQMWFPKKDTGSKLSVSPDFFWPVLSLLHPVPSPSDLPYCRFLETLLVASDSPQRAHLAFFVKRDKLELAFWLLYSIHAVIQVPLEWWAAVPVVAIPSQPALLMWPYVSAARCHTIPVLAHLFFCWSSSNRLLHRALLFHVDFQSHSSQYFLSSEALAICRAVPREHLCLK